MKKIAKAKAILAVNPERISNKTWVITVERSNASFVDGGWRVTKDKCPEIESLKKGDWVIIEVSQPGHLKSIKKLESYDPIEIILRIHKGTPVKEDLKYIIDQICEGYLQGIDNPEGINWEAFLPYKYHKELKRDN